MKKICTFLFLMLISFAMMAQDFQCQMSVNASQIAGSNRNRFNTLQQDLHKFVNDRKWCQYTFKTNERIECAIMINITAMTGDTYEATLTIQLQRPIYGTSY